MFTALGAIRAALQIYGATNRHEYDLADALRAESGGRLRFHRAVTAVQATANIPAPLILARSAREREKSAMADAKKKPVWTVRNALRLFGDRYRIAVGIASEAVGKIVGRAAPSAGERNHRSLRNALKFYGDLWRVSGAFAAPVMRGA